MARAARITAYRTVSATLARHGDDEVRDLLDAAEPVGWGIGGRTLRTVVDGVPVFVKHVRLTDLERRPENVGSTANLFGLPMSCHYGVGTLGGPGFGAWREVAVHAATTGWVLAGDHDGFPLTYHRRVLLDGGAALPEELADVEQAVAYWGGGAGIRRRIDALARSTASVVLVLEHVPQTLHDWFDAQVRAGDDAADRACATVDEQLAAAVAFMGSRGLLHLDAHFTNVLTDGEQLHVADYGLAVSDGFDLAPDEAGFAAAHRDYDRAFVATYLVNWLLVALLGLGPDERRDVVRSCARGKAPEGLPPAVTRILLRDAPVAAVVGDFQRRFRLESRETPYPRDAVRATAARPGRPAAPGRSDGP